LGGGCLCLQFATYYLTTVAELIYFEQFFGQVRPLVLCLCLSFLVSVEDASASSSTTYYLTTVAELIYFEQFFGQVRPLVLCLCLSFLVWVEDASASSSPRTTSPPWQNSSISSSSSDRFAP
jgi:chromate transport protein ChrA